MEEIVARKTRLFFGMLIFFSSIIFGMHVAGQTPPLPPPSASGAPSGAPPGPGTPAQAPAPSSATNGQPANLPAADGTSSGGQPTVSPADIQKMIKDGGGAVMQTPPGSPEMIPAFGAGSMKHFSEPDTKSFQKEKEKEKPKVFVPSDVETVVPHQVKQTDPRAVLHTSMGDITIRLFQNYAPKNVHAFVDLARGDREFTDVKTGRTARRPFYTDLTFHRVVNGFFIQTGCPRGDGRGGPGFFTPDEITSTLQFNKPGIVAMAPERDSKAERKDSNGSQIFITVKSMPEWDGKFTIIGEVEKGMRVVRKISEVKTGPTERPIRRVFLNSIEIFDDASSNTAAEKKDSAQ